MNEPFPHLVGLALQMLLRSGGGRLDSAQHTRRALAEQLRRPGLGRKKPRLRRRFRLGQRGLGAQEQARTEKQRTGGLAREEEPSHAGMTVQPQRQLRRRSAKLLACSLVTVFCVNRPSPSLEVDRTPWPNSFAN
ncbi:MAG TPA: hypothetical protein VGH20_17835 [Myxococcales bacterium]